MTIKIARGGGARKPVEISPNIREHFPDLYFLMQAAAIFPFETEWKTKVAKVVAVYANIITVQLIVCLFMGICFRATDIEALGEYVGVLALICLAVAKILCVTLHRDRIVRLLNRLEAEMRQQRQDPDCLPELIACEKRFANFMWFLSRCAAVIVIALPLTVPGALFMAEFLGWDDGGKTELPHLTWMPFDEYANPAYYFVYALQTTQPASLVFQFLNHICIFTACAMQINSQLRILQMRLRKLNKTDDLGSLRPCLVHHQLTLSLLEEMEDIFNKAMLLEFIAALNIFAVVGLLAMQGSLPFMKTVAMWGIAAFGQAEVFAICWFGDELIHESHGVREAAYDSQWYRSPAAVQKALRFLMMRSHKPVYLTVGKFAPMSLELYGKLMQTTYSLFTLVANTDE